MQALIDFDGWRKWKDFSAAKDAKSTKKENSSLATALKANGNATHARRRSSVTFARADSSDSASTPQTPAKPLSKGGSPSGAKVKPLPLPA